VYRIVFNLSGITLFTKYIYISVLVNATVQRVAVENILNAESLALHAMGQI